MKLISYRVLEEKSNNTSNKPVAARCVSVLESARIYKCTLHFKMFSTPGVILLQNSPTRSATRLVCEARAFAGVCEHLTLPWQYRCASIYRLPCWIPGRVSRHIRYAQRQGRVKLLGVLAGFDELVDPSHARAIRAYWIVQTKQSQFLHRLFTSLICTALNVSYEVIESTVFRRRHHF